MEQDLSIAYQKVVIQSLSRLDPDIGEIPDRTIFSTQYHNKNVVIQFCCDMILLGNLRRNS